MLRSVCGVLWVQLELLSFLFEEHKFTPICNTHSDNIFEHLSDYKKICVVFSVRKCNGCTANKRVPCLQSTLGEAGDGGLLVHQIWIRSILTCGACKRYLFSFGTLHNVGIQNHMLFKKFSKNLPFYAPKNPARAQNWFTRQRMPDIAHVNDCCNNSWTEDGPRDSIQNAVMLISLEPTPSHIQLATRSVSPGVKWPRHEVELSPPSNIEVKNM